MEYIRQWKVGDQVFASKREAQECEARTALGAFVANVDDMIIDADRVIALLKPFATPKTRKLKAGNGATAAKAGKSAKAPVPADLPTA